MSWENTFAWFWELSPKFDLSNSFSIDNKDEKNGSKLDSTEYTYECKLTYSHSPKCSIYTAYEISNVRFKYEGNRDYTENEIKLGLSYHF